jgi:protein-disulfide isomerase
MGEGAGAGDEGRVTISCMKKNINMNTSGNWPIRQVILGFVLFASGIAVGYTARDLPALTGSFGGAAAGASAKDDPSWGPADAKVTIVEFADFECSYCRQWYATVYEQLYANYSSKVRFVYRDFPLSFHPNAQPAAIAANCANAQGKYWDYFRLLFGDPRGLGSAMYQTYAQEVGMDLSAFNSCIANNKYAGEIDLDMKDAQRLGVNGVPAFFINARYISGMQPYETFRAAIEAELNK